MDIKSELKINARKFNKIVIWGLRSKFHTNRYIFQGYFGTLKKLGIPVMWIEDQKKNKKIVEANDLIISAEVQGRMVPEKQKLDDYNLPIRDDVYYCLHNFKDIFISQISPRRLLKLQVYSNAAEKFPKIREAVHYDLITKTLFQPWGTNLLEEEFCKPVFSSSKFVFWVGSVWNNAQNQGNLNEIQYLKEILGKHKLKFVHTRFVPDRVNTFLIRSSRMAPAIGGRAQVEMDYLPCRMFKNISYGQLGFSNIKKFQDILGEGCVYEENMEALVNKVLSLPKGSYTEIIRLQQETCKQYTYAHHLNNIFTHA